MRGALKKASSVAQATRREAAYAPSMRFRPALLALVLAGCAPGWKVAERASPNPFVAPTGFEIAPTDVPEVDAGLREGFFAVSDWPPCTSCGYRIETRITGLLLPDDQLGPDSVLRAQVTISDPKGATDVVLFEPHLAHKNNWASHARRTKLLGDALGRRIAYYLRRRAKA